MKAKIIPSYLAAAAFFFVLSFCAVIFADKDRDPSFHKEIIPSDGIGYFDEHENFIKLADGNYFLAMPKGGTFIHGVAPMLMVRIGRDYYPLNIADDSMLPRRGITLNLKILFGFTSPHASNTLTYAEKTGGDPVEEYHRKSRYYLHVENGYGTVQRSYYYQ